MTNEEILEAWEARLKRLKKDAGKRWEHDWHNKILIAQAYELELCIFMLKNGRYRTIEDTKAEIRSMSVT